MNGTTHRWLLAAAVGIVSLALYAATLAPGLTWAHDSADGGDLAVAANALGVAHPPGYPTYVLMAYPWTRLPIGEVATRTNLFSSFCSALAAAAVAWSIAAAGGRRIAALIGGVALAGSPLFWSQAIVTEVHALQGLFGALLLAIAVAGPENAGGDGRSRQALGLCAGLLWGLALGNTPLAIFYLPLVVLAAVQLRASTLIAGGIALGLSIYALLPAACLTRPASNWGDASKLQGFLRIVSASLFRRYAFAFPLHRVPARVLAMSRLLARQFGPVGLGLAGGGAAATWPTQQRLQLATALGAALFSAFAIGYDTTDSHLYLLPIVVFLAFWLGLGADAIVRMARDHGRLPAIAVCGIGSMILAIVIACRAPEMSLRRDATPAETVRVSLEAAPTRAVIVTNRDTHTFSLWYYTQAVGVRTDVTVVDAALVGYEWYDSQLPAEIRVGAVSPPEAGHPGALSDASRLVGRPVCLMIGDHATLVCGGA